MLEAAATFAASINYTEPYWLTLCGPSGIGKTHLARAVMRQFVEQNRFNLMLDAVNQHIYGNTWTYCDWRKFCANLREGGYGLLDDIIEEWFVVIDDLGADRDPTGFIADATDRIFNGRQGKWTLITTNLSLSDIESTIDPRVADRMIRGKNVVVESDAKSYALGS